MLYQWFIVVQSLGLYPPLGPCRRIKQHSSTKKPTIPQSPPAPNYRYLRFLFATYLLLTCTHVYAIHQEIIAIFSLSASPIALFSLSGFICTRQCQEQRKILKLLKSTPCAHPYIGNNHPSFDSFIETSSNSKKLAMLSTWQTTNSKTPVVMDYEPGSKAICINTGASACISNYKNDFISYSPVTDQVISGISSGLSVAGCGTLCWNIRDDDGNNIILHISDALHVPNIPICLLCPQQVAKQTGKASDGFLASRTHGIFTYDGFTRTVPYKGQNSLPLLFATKLDSNVSSSNICNNDHTNALVSIALPLSPEGNLTRTQRKLLCIHECMSHISSNTSLVTATSVNPFDVSVHVKNPYVMHVVWEMLTNAQSLLTLPPSKPCT